MVQRDISGRLISYYEAAAVGRLDSESLVWAIRELLGIIYFLAWSLSFYPQPIANLKRKSVSGTTIDFPVTNLASFSAYTLYTAGFLISSTIKEEYASRHPNSPVTTVRWIDFAFALHGWIIIALLLCQFFWYDDKIRNGSAHRRPSRPISSICGIAAFIALIAVGYAIGDDGHSNRHGLLEWIDVLYILSAIKLVLTLVKYVPQVILNARRRSTKGWTISTILLDATGSVASMSQLVLDSIVHGSLRDGVMGNLVKLLLGLYSLFFDIIFIYQHYVAYPQSKAKDDEEVDGIVENGNGEERLLLGHR